MSVLVTLIAVPALFALWAALTTQHPLFWFVGLSLIGFLLILAWIWAGIDPIYIVPAMTIGPGLCFLAFFAYEFVRYDEPTRRERRVRRHNEYVDSKIRSMASELALFHQRQDQSIYTLHQLRESFRRVGADETNYYVSMIDFELSRRENGRLR